MDWPMKLQGLDGNAVWETEPQGRLLVIDDDPFLRATLREQFAAGIAWGEAKKQLFELINQQLFSINQI